MLGAHCPTLCTGSPLQSPVQALQLDNFSWRCLELAVVSSKPLSPLVAVNFPPWQIAGGGDTEVVVHEGEMHDHSQWSWPLGFCWAETTDHSLLSPLPPAWPRITPWPPTALLPPCLTTEKIKSKWWHQHASWPGKDKGVDGYN